MSDREEKDDQAKKQKEAEERSSPGGAVVYEAIRQEGKSELERKSSSLMWSGLAAGLSMGFSFLGEGILRDRLPNAEWRPLVTKLGYSFGFLIVVLGRQQLFTENTLTVILPFLDKKRMATLLNIGRLWLLVLLTNLVGAFVFALTMARTKAIDPALRHTLMEIGREAFDKEASAIFMSAIFAGWLIALMVWLLPFAEQLRVVVIILITYLVGVGEFAHVIAGSVEVMHLVAAGELGFGAYVGHYLLPTLAGNTLGGVLLVAILGHVQFGSESPVGDA